MRQFSEELGNEKGYQNLLISNNTTTSHKEELSIQDPV